MDTETQGEALFAVWVRALCTEQELAACFPGGTIPAPPTGDISHPAAVYAASKLMLAVTTRLAMDTEIIPQEMTNSMTGHIVHTLEMLHDPATLPQLLLRMAVSLSVDALSQLENPPGTLPPVKPGDPPMRNAPPAAVKVFLQQHPEVYAKAKATGKMVFVLHNGQGTDQLIAMGSDEDIPEWFTNEERLCIRVALSGRPEADPKPGGPMIGGLPPACIVN